MEWLEYAFYIIVIGPIALIILSVFVFAIVEGLSGRKTVLKKENEKLKENLENTKKEIEKAKESEEKYRKENDTLRESLSTSESKNERLKTELEAAKNINADIIWALDKNAVPEEMEKEIERLNKENKSLKTQNANLKKYKQQEETEKKKKVWEKFFTKAESVLEEKYQLNTFFESVGTSRFEKAMSNEVEMVNMEIFAEFSPKDDAEDSVNYKTTLKGCTCPDCKYNGVHVCKHMLHLAYTVGALQLKSKRFDSTKKQLIEDIKENAKTIEGQKKEIANANKRIKKLKEKEKALKSNVDSQ